MWVFWLICIWFGAWGLNIWLTSRNFTAAPILAPLVLGATMLVLWEIVVAGLGLSAVILPAPSAIFLRFGAELDLLWGDFNQTVIKGALRGFAIGVSAALLCALAIDRSRFLTKGLLPIGNFIAAMPIIGIAPIMVNWFGFDWQSKAAVVVIMVFFPILVNTTQGLQASHAIHRDLMKTYGASYWQVLCAMRLPSALPFIFNGLKISATLALIGAIVAEYFGSPTRGMGFRISTGVGRLDMDLVWAEIFVAALVGTGFYGAVTLAERYFTFWHPSQRNR